MRRRTIPLLLAIVIGAVACGGDDPVTAPEPTVPVTTTAPPETSRLDVDPRDYYDDYASAPMEDMSATAGAPNVVPVAAEAGDGAVEPMPPEWPGPLDDNVFVDSGDSTWTAVADDGESTFALDVDTGSFTVGRTLLEQGYLPEPDSIRVEEWVNAVDRTDAPPTDGADIGVTVETHASPRAEPGTQLVRIGVSTRTLADAERPPANLTFVVDASGSMDIRERLGLVQASLALLAQQLRDDDTIAIVTYGDDATPLLPPTPVHAIERVVAAIDGLVPGGSTNLESGLRLGYEQARATFRPGALNVVVLASDGVANVGVTDATVLTDQITQAGEEGIHLVTVGFGMGNYNDQLMEQLADMGDGFYGYVDTFEEAQRLFVDELTPTLTVVAGDAKAQVRFDPAMVGDYRLVGYENRELDDSEFRDDTVDAGELGAGHHVTALYEVRMATAPSGGGRAIGAPSGAPLGTVSLRWTSTATGEVEETTVAIQAANGAPGDSFRLAAVTADLAELWKGNAVIAERPAVTLDALAAEAADVAASGVDGADELVAMIDLARRIQG